MYCVLADRYYGQNDPVAAKIFEKAKNMPKLEPPADRSIMTLFVGGVTPDVKEQDLRYAQRLCPHGGRGCLD